MKPFIVANWKMNPQTLQEAKELFDRVVDGVEDIKNAEVVICPPFVYISDLVGSAFAKGYGGLRLGAQNCFWEESGAYTGEVSPKMLKDLGCQYVILGHSERRINLGETDEMINKKVKAVLSAGLEPILCIENLNQLREDLKNVSGKIIIAFEPVLAIGTGKSCGISEAKKVRENINYPEVFYGGSVDSKNALGYIKEAGFDGLLVGGASLVPEEFIKIVNAI